MPEELKFSTKAMPGQLTVDEAEGIVEAFVAGIGNKDSVGDIVLPGAFSASLKRRKPRVVWGHNWNEPIGKVLDIYEVGPDDPRLPKKMKDARIGGLFARVQFNLKSERGREAFANIAFFGMEQEWSIGYKTITAAYDNSRQANLLREVELYEVSPVLHGANQLTGTISIKSDNPEDRVSSFKKSKWPMFDRQFAEMIKEEHPKIWDAGGNIKGDDQYTILTKIAEQGGVAQTEDQIKALELREAWVARHEGDFLLPGVIAQIKWLAIGSRGEGHMKDVVREAISKANKDEKAEASCPIATRDVAVNIKNRQNAIDTAAYGPLNPELPNDKYWAARADRWDVTPDEARKQTCGNCSAFLKTPRILDCIKQGLGNETGNDAMSVIDAGDLGYCESFDFKCASARTCDGWVSGGPVTEEKKGYGYGATETPYEDEPKGRGYGGYEREGSSDDDPMEELGRIAARMRMSDDEEPTERGQTNEAMGRRAVLARALANELRTPVRIRSISGNTVVFDVMDESEEPTTMRSSWHAENGRVMIGRPERVRVETVYVPETGDSGGNAYMGDEEFKAPIPPDAIPQERITGDVLRGRGPRRGNLERLLRYWRPIMRKPGGFRRCLVILADHPELYPLANICAWLHHETTGLWPNEGCHHPGMKNCRRKLRGVVRGSLISDSEFDNRLRRLDSKPDGKGMPDPFEWDSEKGDMGEVTEEDIAYANKVMNWFVGEEKDFMEYLAEEKNWMHEGDDEDGESYEHEWIKPTNAPATISGKKPGGCGCGCSGVGGKGSCMDDEKSLEDELIDLQAKVGRALNSRNADKISQAIRLLSEVVGEEAAGVAMQRKDDTVVLEAPIEDLFELREMIDPIVEHYALEAEVDEKGIHIHGLMTDGVEMALKTAIANFDDIQTKSLHGSESALDRFVSSFVNVDGKAFIPRDGDGDGFFSPAPKAPDKTPISKLPEAMAKVKDSELIFSLRKRPLGKRVGGRIQPVGTSKNTNDPLFKEQVDSYVELRRRGRSEDDLKKIAPKNVVELGESKFGSSNDVSSSVVARRAAKPSAEKPKPAKDSPEDFKKRFEEVNSLGQFKRHEPTMRILDDIDDALDNEDLDDKTRLDLLSAQIDIIENFDLPDNGVEQAAEFWSRIETAMDRADDLKVSDANSKKADELYERMLNIYEGIQQAWKTEYERSDWDEIFNIEPYVDLDPPD